MQMAQGAGHKARDLRHCSALKRDPWGLSLKPEISYDSLLGISRALHLSIFHHPAGVSILVLVFRPYFAFINRQSSIQKGHVFQ
jgi:hypothetical protein